MIRGLYTGASGMLAAQIQSDIISDNIANVRTPGYKEEAGVSTAFPNMLVERLAKNPLPERVPLGRLGTGVVVNQVMKITQQGPLQTTNKATDLALTSPGFFVVQTPNGERYTRNGNFQLNGQGMLQTSEGYLLLDRTGRPIGPLGNNFTVQADGTVVEGDRTFQIQIVDIPPNALRREGQSLYAATQQPVVLPAGSVGIWQGAIEGSNVDVAGQMVQMITVMRAYEANQKVIQTQDATLEKAVNEIGKI